MTDAFMFATARTPADWQSWSHRNTRIDADGVTIASNTDLRCDPLDIECRDMDAVPTGNLAVLTPEGQTAVYVEADDALRTLSLSGGFDDADALGATRTGLTLVGGDRIGGFSRRRRKLDWHAEQTEEILAIAGGRHRTYVLERTDDGTDRVRVIDADGSDRIAVDGLENAIDITVGPDETWYVIAEPDGGPVLIRAESRAGRDEKLDRFETLPDADLVGVTTGPGRSVSLIGREEGAARWWEWTPTGVGQSVDIPQREWSTIVSADVDGSDRIAYLRSTDGQVWELRRSAINRKDPENTRYEGRLVGRFDAGRDGIEWHRTALDVDRRGPETRVDLSYFATDRAVPERRLDEIIDIDEKDREALRTAGIDGAWDLIEQPLEDIAAVVDTTVETIEGWQEAARRELEASFDQRDDVRRSHDPDDLLLSGATGRYLFVEIRLVGRRVEAPRLESITAYCPRQSYVRYLPEIYRQQQSISPFLGRFLSIFESVFVDVERELDRHTRLLDPEEVPLDDLAWLNEWLGVDLGDTWPESARRELLDRATELYRLRGTNRGLRAVIDIYLDAVPRIEDRRESTLVQIERRLEELVEAGFVSSRAATTTIERYREQFSESGTDVFFFEYAQLDGLSDRDRDAYSGTVVGHPRRFQVYLTPRIPPECVGPVEDIVESEKPAYADAGVDRLEPRFQLGAPTFLGINTVCPNSTFELGESRIGWRRPVLEPNS